MHRPWRTRNWDGGGGRKHREPTALRELGEPDFRWGRPRSGARRPRVSGGTQSRGVQSDQLLGMFGTFGRGAWELSGGISGFRNL